MKKTEVDNPDQAYKYCFKCGNKLFEEAEICPKCGVRQPNTSPPIKTSNRNKLTAALLALILGGLGAHKFYLGKPIQGIIYLFLFWTVLPFIIGFIEGLNYLSMSEEVFNDRYKGSSRKAKGSRLPTILAIFFAIVGVVTLISVIPTSPSTSIQQTNTTSDLHSNPQKLEALTTAYCDNRRDDARPYPILDLVEGQQGQAELKPVEAKPGTRLTQTDCTMAITALTFSKKLDHLEDIVERKYWVGMDYFELGYSLGLPDGSSTRSTTDWLGVPGESGTWTYTTPTETVHFNYQDGKVTDWQVIK